ncbi:membrane bound O-acyl transferase family-domain-containing protein [Cadophora sp. MPI-SDFR-AT-0126]|nr:membrane bound O-acyl transferase family-domain-containing protein [Leotiomycetes sp. MPI-SDFR-AT-0126]
MSIISATLDDRLDPVIYASVQLFLSAAVLGFTAPSSFLRHAVVPVLFACSYSFLIYARVNIPQPYASIASSLLWCFFLSYISMAILSGWSFEAKGPASQLAAKEKKDADNKPRDEAAKVEKKTGSAGERICFGFRSIFSFRDCGTPFEVKNVPPFIYNDPSFVPSAPAFILRSAVTAIICYFVIDFIESQPPPPNAAQIFSLEKVSVLRRLGEITQQEALTRIAASSGFWVVLSSLMMGSSSLVNIVCVLLGLSKVENCKSLLGPMSEAYTVRGFWGHSWHQATRKVFATPASYAVDEWFVFQRHSPPNTYSTVFVTFFMSGLLHAMADWTNGMDWEMSGALKFFYFQAAGIVVEDFVQLIYRLSSGRDLKDPPRLWTRMLGYVWVGFFLLFWTTPGWCYPSVVMNLGTNQGKLIPYDFSYFRKFAKQQ